MQSYSGRNLALALVVSLATPLLCSPVLTPPIMAQETNLRTLTVTGQGQQAVQTTKTQVSLGVDLEGTDAAVVQRQVAERTSAVVELLRSRRVEKLETTGLQLSPRYRYDNGQSQLVGYSGSNTVSFQMPTEAVGTLLDDAVKAGANQIRGVSFIADDTALEAARQEALKRAVADAQAQAAAVLGALNLRSQEVVSIEINGAIPPRPMPMARQVAAAPAADMATPVMGGEQTVQARVTLQIRY
ncbi:MAG: SIMPL domain-containing protein [Cyanobacteriota bacterium]|nr:SIMPL domain-containing protein [Cyanobacteriota bacterium]